jgi:hypothetical protein
MYSLVAENVVVGRVRTLREAYGAAREFIGECRPVDVEVHIWKKSGTRTEYLGSMSRLGYYMEKVA